MAEAERKRDWRTYDLGPKPLSEFLALDGQGEWVGRLDAERLLAVTEAENAKLREALNRVHRAFRGWTADGVIRREIAAAGLIPDQVIREADDEDPDPEEVLRGE